MVYVLVVLVLDYKVLLVCVFIVSSASVMGLVHAASACEKSLISVATRGRSVEGSEIAISFIYVSKVCQSCQQYVLELGKLCVRRCGIASPVNLLIGITWRGGISHIIIVQRGIHCSLQLYTRSTLSVVCSIPVVGLSTTIGSSVVPAAIGTERQ